MSLAKSNSAASDGDAAVREHDRKRIRQLHEVPTEPELTDADAGIDLVGHVRRRSDHRRAAGHCAPLSHMLPEAGARRPPVSSRGH